MKIKFRQKFYYLLVVAIGFFLMFLIQSVFAQAYIPITNNHNGISIGIQGTQGTDYIFDRYYFDPLVNDCGLCYIKSNVDITLAHNEYNSRIDELKTVIVGGEEGEIRYKVDRDWQRKSWAGTTTNIYPLYQGPISFNDLQYEAGVPVVGTTGFNPGVPLADRENSYSRGLLDYAGNEYHYFTYADDDDHDPNGGFQLEKCASDGKSMLFCVNPKTPAIWLNATTSSAQYYTTPAKVYWIPKIFEQISYVTDNVNINLKNIMNSNSVYYRIDGGAYSLYSGAISSNTLSDGEHILEFYYNSSYVQTRKIVKNPEHPSKQDVFEDGTGHGYLLWKNDAEFLRFKERMLNGVWSNSNYYTISYSKFKNDYLDNLDYPGNEGIRNNGSGNALMYAMVGVLEGVSANTEYMDASKIRLLSNKRMHIEDIGWETNHAASPNPAHELTFRGYYDDWQLYDNAFAYDLLVKYYRSDQYANGITPIEDYRLRDMLVLPIQESLLWFGAYRNWQSPDVNPNPQDEMWSTAHQNAAFVAALAMPSYDTHYYGTSGFNGAPATHEWTPYPDDPITFKELFITYTNQDDPAQVALLKPFPNRCQLFNWFNGTTTKGLIRADGNWHDRIGYGGESLMGHGMEFFCNVMKRKLNIAYPKLELYMRKSLDRNVYCYKDEAYAGYPRRSMANEYFPDLAPDAIDANDSDEKYFYRVKPYYFFFHNPDWEDVEFCQSTSPATVPSNFSVAANETSVNLSWSPSTHADCSVSGYRIKRNGIEITTVQGTQYSVNGLLAQSQYEYSVASVSEAGVVSAFCSPVLVTTTSIPPIVSSVPNTNDPTSVTIEFNEAMNEASVENLSNYSINNGIIVTSAQLLVGDKSVVLSVSPLSTDVQYIITINNVTDVAGSVIAENTTANFEYIDAGNLINLALNKPVSFSSQQVENKADKLVNGDTSDDSRWSAENFPQWVEIDLGANYDLARMDFYPYQARDYQYVIEAKPDGGNYSVVADRSSNTTASTLISDDVEINARYVKITIIGAYAYSGTWVSANELEVYGYAGSTLPVPVTGVSVSPTTLTLNVGQSSDLTESVNPSNASNKTVSWSSNNTSVATVDANGIVSAQSGGQAIVTVAAADGGYTASCSVTVKPTAGDVNLALGKVVTVSSEPQTDNGASKIVDNDTTDDSRWSAELFPQWAVIDLGEDCDIAKFEVYPYLDRDYQYIIQLSDDGTDFITVVDRSSNTEAVNVLTNNVSASGRYVKIVLSGAYSYTGDWASISELKVYGTIASSVINVTGVSVLPSSLTLDEGLSSDLTETVSPVDAIDKSVTWSSSDNAVATVDANGLVSAVSAGIATITVTTTDGNFTANCALTVNPIVVITLIEAEEYTTVDGCIIDSKHDGFTGTGFLDYGAQGTYAEWSNINGGAGGTATLTIRYANGSTDARSCDIMVNGQTSGSITVNPTGDWTNWVTETVNVTFNVGTVNTVKIVASTSFGGPNIDNFEATVNGGCNQPVTSVSLNTSSAILDIHETIELNAIVLPLDACDMSVVWSSSNSSIASVNAGGEVTANASGSTTISATTNDGSYTANCAITVVIPVSGVSISPTIMSIEEGQTSDLTAAVSPSNATNLDVSWSSNNTSVATVNSSGLVTAISEGNALISVTTSDGNFTSNCIVTVTAPILNGLVESVGNGSASTISAYNGWDNGSPVVYSGGSPISGLNEVQTGYPSDTYPGASGGSNVHIKGDDNGNAGWFMIEGINTSLLNNPSISFGLRHISVTAKSYFDVYYSTNGTSWTELTERSAFPELSTWGYLTYYYLPSVPDLKIKFEETKKKDIWIDDIEIIEDNLKGLNLTTKSIRGIDNIRTVVTYPNPVVNNMLNICFNNYDAGTEIMLQIVDLAGRLIHEEQIMIQSKKHVVVFNDYLLKKGIYFLKVHEKKRHQAFKFIVK